MMGGIFALLVRLSLLNAKHMLFGKVWVTAETYNRFFTLHGAIMVFLFIIPAIPASLGNFVLPLMLGAKDVAFPRLNLASFYLWVTGAVMAVSSMVIGAVDTGWTFYTPYSTTTDGAVGLMTMAVFVLGFSSIFTGLNFIATVHKLRAPGMGWFDMPLFIWGIYATGVIQILATPVLAITLVLLLLERVFQIGIFDSRIGGDPVLFLLAPRGVHHDSAGHGDHQRADSHIFAQDYLRLSRHRVFQRVAGAAELRRVGPPSVRGRAV
jgi:cytochrome c oxidase subunit 1